MVLLFEMYKHMLMMEEKSPEVLELQQLLWEDLMMENQLDANCQVEIEKHSQANAGQ